MIKEQKLKELIEKEATIYTIYDKKSWAIWLNIRNEESGICDIRIKDNNLYLRTFELFTGEGIHQHHDMFDTISYKIKDLYETKAEAEFIAEFCNVEKVVKMPVPPTWEEVCLMNFDCENKIVFGNYTLFIYRNFFIINKYVFKKFNCKDKNCCWNYEDTYFKTADEILRLEHTEENYYKALDKMVELFKEEV